MPYDAIPLALCLLTAVVHAADDGFDFDPAVVDDVEARNLHSYLRRTPKCKPPKAGKAKSISKKLHQIWWQGEATIPVHFEPLMRTWRVKNPDWAFKLWDQQSVGALVNESFSWFAPTFHALPSKIQQADAARYIILMAEGGLYADLDVECFKPFNDIL